MDNSQRKLAAEFVGTFALIFAGAGAAIQGADLVGQALANGLAIGLMVTAVGHISGGHFNPAVTLSMLVTGRIEPGEAVTYWFAQLAGATAAALVLLATFPSAVHDAVNLGVPAVGKDPISSWNALVAEIVGTFFLVFVIYGVAVDKRGTFKILAGLPIGLMITVDILAIGGVSGGAVNPARWFGPALVSGTFDNFWVWILGPAIGAMLAGLAYDRILLRGTEGE
jgi:aquaporin TIP